jgi:hypothetical protein
MAEFLYLYRGTEPVAAALSPQQHRITCDTSSGSPR